MKIKNGDMPAMPCTKATGEVFEGLTKREMFAMHALTAVIAKDGHQYGNEPYKAECAVRYADALLAELDK